MKKLSETIRKKIVLALTICMLLMNGVMPAYADEMGTNEAVTDEIIADENIFQNDETSHVDKISEVAILVESVNFTDVSETDWFYADVMELARRGIVNGKEDGRFDPYGKVTVAEFLKMAVESQKLNLEENTTTYWAKPYIDVALHNEIIKGADFAAYSRTMTREEMSYIAIGTFILHNDIYGSLEKVEIIDDISDYAAISEKYKSYVLDTYLTGLITGKGDGKFNPKETLTRAEAAAVIMRIIDESRRTPFDLSYIPHVDTMYNKFDPITEEETEVFDPDDKTTWDGCVWKKSVLYAPLNVHGERETRVLDLLEFGKTYGENSKYVAGEGYNHSKRGKENIVVVGTSNALNSEWDNLSVNQMILSQELSLSVGLEKLSDASKYPYFINFYYNNQSMEELKAKHGELWDFFMELLFEDEKDVADKFICDGIAAGRKIPDVYNMERKIINGRMLHVSVFNSGIEIYISNDVY